jgi:hypothetical protein
MTGRLPAKVKHIAEVADCDERSVGIALRSLINRSLVLPDADHQAFALVPLVADFLRIKRPAVITETGSHLEKRAFTLILENNWF